MLVSTGLQTLELLTGLQTLLLSRVSKLLPPLAGSKAKRMSRRLCTRSSFSAPTGPTHGFVGRLVSTWMVIAQVNPFLRNCVLE